MLSTTHLSPPTQVYPLWGNCWFTFTEVKDEDGGMELFSVLVQQQTDEKGRVTRSVKLLVYDMEITMATGTVWEIKV